MMPRSKTGPARTKAKSKAAKPAVGELLLEIGTEELPYQFIQPALRSLHSLTEQLLNEQRLTYGAVRTFGTPRRLTLSVSSLCDRQAAMTKETMGPSKAVAYDAAGQPTRAAVGFAAGQGVPVEELEVRQTPKGEYLFAVKRETGQPTASVLTELLPALIGKLSFPKSMTWNDTGARFGRPIRWLLALYAGKSVPFQIAGVRSGARTWGHRFLGPASRTTTQGLPVADLKSYLRTLEQHGVIPDQDRRRELILAQVEKLTKAAGGRPHRDEALLDQAVFTTECPHPLLGGFNPQYLSLPKEILMTSMKEHQGFFSVLRKDGTLLPAFVSVTNMKLANMKLIQAGNERVLAARLADARFFFDEDRKVRLADRVEKLKGITFHKKIGTVFEKQERVRQVTDRLATMFALDRETSRACARAAELCKADLTTGIVGEFPALQGIMGGEYAKHDGEADQVRQAIAEHYLPPSMEGDIPGSTAGKVLSLADRLDTIFTFFRVGLVPSGSEDPFALRRNALAVVRIALEGRLPLNLGEFHVYMSDLLDDKGFKPATTSSDPVDFLLERLRFYGRTIDGLRDDVMLAVLKSTPRSQLNLLTLYDKMNALQAITARPEFNPLTIGFKRAHRIVEKEKWEAEEINPSLFQHQSETELYKALEEARLQVPFSITQGDYTRALDGLVLLKPAIDAFFAGVMVNADDQGIRANRLSLLRMIDRLFLSFADLSEILVPGV
ncbi:MAG: glycine--tRNA ligase subunit beta [Nitrospira sp.]|nr:glycine--tRNA ligase subunit beta [Nitrospira sp.]